MKSEESQNLFEIAIQQKGEFINKVDDQVLEALEKKEISYVYQKGIGFIDGNNSATRFIETSDFGAEKPFFGSCVCVVVHSSESKLTGVLHADTNTDIAKAMELMKERVGARAEVSIIGGQNDVSEPILEEIRDNIKDNEDWGVIRLDILGDKNVKTRQVVVDASNGNVYNLQGHFATDLKPWDFWGAPEKIVKREGQKNLSSEKLIVDVDFDT